MNEIWQQISGYIMPIITVLLSSSMGAILVRALSSSWFKKHDLNAMANQFASKLTGSKISIDLRAVTEKQLDKIDRNLEQKLAKLAEQVNMILTYQGDIISCISSSAKLKSEESAKLISDLEGIKHAIEPIGHKEEITIELKSSVATDEPSGEISSNKSMINWK